MTAIESNYKKMEKTPEEAYAEGYAFLLANIPKIDAPPAKVRDWIKKFFEWKGITLSNNNYLNRIPWDGKSIHLKPRSRLVIELELLGFQPVYIDYLVLAIGEAREQLYPPQSWTTIMNQYIVTGAHKFKSILERSRLHQFSTVTGIAVIFIACLLFVLGLHRLFGNSQL